MVKAAEAEWFKTYKGHKKLKEKLFEAEEEKKVLDGAQIPPFTKASF